MKRRFCFDRCAAGDGDAVCRRRRESRYLGDRPAVHALDRRRRRPRAQAADARPGRGRDRVRRLSQSVRARHVRRCRSAKRASSSRRATSRSCAACRAASRSRAASTASGFGKLNPLHPHAVSVRGALPRAGRRTCPATSRSTRPGVAALGADSGARGLLAHGLGGLAAGRYVPDRARAERRAATIRSTSTGDGDRADEPRPAVRRAALRGFVQVGDRSGLELGVSATRGHQQRRRRDAHHACSARDVKAKLWTRRDSLPACCRAKLLHLDREDAGWDATGGRVHDDERHADRRLRRTPTTTSARATTSAPSFERFQQPDADEAWDQAFGASPGSR